MPTAPNPPARRAREHGNETRRAVLDAALHEFSAVGFDAASTRAIATRAGIAQGQLTYHFATKDVLWRATVDHLFDRFNTAFAAALAAQEPLPDDRPATRFEASVRALVRAVAGLPELNRMMVHEATTDSDRLDWLVDRHVRIRFEQHSALWRQVQADGDTHLSADPLVMYYCVLGAASLLYVNAPEAALLLGAGRVDTATEALVDAHADTLVAMLLGPPRRSRRRRPNH